jgi:hypothetical protein
VVAKVDSRLSIYSGPPYRERIARNASPYVLSARAVRLISRVKRSRLYLSSGPMLYEERKRLLRRACSGIKGFHKSGVCVSLPLRSRVALKGA